jgi:hypothetical protein
MIIKELILLLSEPSLLLSSSKEDGTSEKLKFKAAAYSQVELNNFKVLRTNNSENKENEVDIDVTFKKLKKQSGVDRGNYFLYYDYVADLTILCDEDCFNQLQTNIKKLDLLSINIVNAEDIDNRKRKLTESSYEVSAWSINIKL